MTKKFNPVLVTVKPRTDIFRETKQTITEERLFTSAKKLNSYLKMLNKYYLNLKIDFKSYKV